MISGINSDGVISGINYHSLEGSASGGQQGFGIIDVGGWGVNETGSEDAVWVSGVAQMMAHVSALGTTDPTTTMHGVAIGPGSTTLGTLVVDGVGQLPALQAAAFVTSRVVHQGTGPETTSQLTLLVINRGRPAVSVEVDLSAIAHSIGVPCDSAAMASVRVQTTSYSGLDRGGWQRLSLSEIGSSLPLPGPMTPQVNHTKLALRGSSLAGVRIAGLSMHIIEVTI